MKCTSLNKIGILVLLIGNFACSEPPKMQTAKRQASKQQGPLQDRQPSGVSWQLGPLLFDAVDYTVAAQSLSLSAKVSGYQRQAVLPKQATENQIKLAEAICQDIALGNTDGIVESGAIAGADQSELQIIWRSYFEDAYKVELANNLLDDLTLECMLSLELADSGRMDIVFTPVASHPDQVSGSRDLSEAMNRGLLLIDTKKTGTVLSGGGAFKLLNLSDEMVLPLGVRALNSQDLIIKADQAEAVCRYHELDGDKKLGNPDAIQSFSFQVESNREFALQSLRQTSSGGRFLASCESAELKQEELSLAIELSCRDYVNLLQESAGDSCGWIGSFQNPQDPRNEIDLGLRLANLELSVIDISTPQGAASVIEPAAENPIRNQQLDVSTFNNAQQDSLARMFDFWLTASPMTFKQYFAAKMRRIIYEGTTGDACSEVGVLAYVESLDTDTMFWCEAAGMRAQDLQEQQSPLVLMLIGVTALHETLHAVGREHDFDAPQVDPCKGTSESALFSYDTIVNCKHDSCFAMKDLAIQEYIAELDYSLQADGRRFQGLCQQWNDGLGIVAADFGS